MTREDIIAMICSDYGEKRMTEEAALRRLAEFGVEEVEAQELLWIADGGDDVIDLDITPDRPRA